MRCLQYGFTIRAAFLCAKRYLSHLEMSMQVRLEGTGLITSCCSSVGRNALNALTYSKDGRSQLQEQVNEKYSNVREVTDGQKEGEQRKCSADVER